MIFNGFKFVATSIPSKDAAINVDALGFACGNIVVSVFFGCIKPDHVDFDCNLLCHGAFARYFVGPVQMIWNSRKEVKTKATFFDK